MPNLRAIQCGREESRGGFEQPQRAGEFGILFFQFLQLRRLRAGHTECPFVDRLGSGAPRSPVNNWHPAGDVQARRPEAGAGQR